MLHAQTLEAARPTEQTDAVEARRLRIRELNDDFRIWRGRGPFLGRLVKTQGISNKSPLDQIGILAAVRTFNAFNADNDPHGEHDFGAFDFKGERILWKIDYFDRLYCAGSNDPSDPDTTCRVLTVMLASEY